MNKNIKYALVFTGIMTICLGICGISLISHVLNVADNNETELIDQKV